MLTIPEPEKAEDGRERYAAMLAEAREDVMHVKLGLAQILVLEVVWRYSLAVGRAEAWIPSLQIFVIRTGMGKKELGTTLEKLECYQILRWEKTPEAKFPEARTYKYFPRSVGAWLIAPRVTNQRSRDRAATIDRWLCALNANGGPGQGEFFPQLWDHEDALAEWSPRSDEPPQVSPDRSMQQRAQSPDFRVCEEPAILRATPGEPGRGVVETVLDRGEKPHAWGKTPRSPLNDWNAINERRVSHSEHASHLMPTVGKNPTPSATVFTASRGEAMASEPGCDDAEERLGKGWPTWQIENRLMRRLFGMFDAWYPPDRATEIKEKYGAIWRWRIRQWPFAVEKAIDTAAREWPTIQELGGFLQREWLKTYKKGRPKVEAPAPELPEMSPEEIRARIEASLGEGAQ